MAASPSGIAETIKQIATTVADIFQQLFRAIAEQRGVTLQQTRASVNIKERLDFSCTLFAGAVRTRDSNWVEMEQFVSLSFVNP
ncbi:MAG TPA: hydantoinase B/oxoprolinase family protein [Thermosynechococcus sp. M46_R2017_013]|nr:hydantoinase B/oxoprolinase family protein [Thermosynechococcus sp. M46_R2017_013]